MDAGDGWSDDRRLRRKSRCFNTMLHVQAVGRNDSGEEARDARSPDGRYSAQVVCHGDGSIVEVHSGKSVDLQVYESMGFQMHPPIIAKRISTSQSLDPFA